MTDSWSRNSLSILRFPPTSSTTFNLLVHTCTFSPPYYLRTSSHHARMLNLLGRLALSVDLLPAYVTPLPSI
jgi:hypothetical protein